MSNILEIKDLNVRFGGIRAVDGISMNVQEGKIITLIGANGAGKSTILRSVSGIVRPASGDILLNGESIVGLSPDKIVARGVTLVPEGRRVFPNLTVLENLKIGAYLRKDKDGIAKDRAWVYSLFPRLQERTWQLGATLSGGEQQMLAVGRALMSRPKLLMLDEPSLGLAPLIIKDIFTIIQQIKDAGVNVLLIEQNAKAALEISDYAYVMETGNITMAGPGRALMNDERVKAAYLGE